MTRKERILAAIRREEVDRIPHATYNIQPYFDGAHSQEPTYSEILAQIKATAGVAVKLYVGGLGIGLSAETEGVSESRVEGSGDERTYITTVHTPKGDLTNIVRAPENKPNSTIKHLVESDDDIEKYLSLPYNPPLFDASEVRKAYNAVGDGGVVFVTYSEPMYATAELFNFEDFCIRCLTDLDGIKRMIDWAFERSMENVRLLTKACSGMDCILHTSGPEVCTPPMLSPKVFAELVTPYTAKLTDIIHEAGLLSAIHCHGHVREVFPEMLKTGADLLEPIEPMPQGNITLDELMEQAEGKICLMGHIQDQEFYSAPEGHFTSWVEHIAGIVNGRTGYIMSPTCTPFEFPCGNTYNRNYLEWLRAADRIL